VLKKLADDTKFDQKMVNKSDKNILQNCHNTLCDGMMFNVTMHVNLKLSVHCNQSAQKAFLKNFTIETK